MSNDTVIIRWLGRMLYNETWHAMQHFTNERQPDTLDELWLLEHESVFTQGQNGKAHHILNPGIIPVVQTDRGGQVTYHGPGQLMIYTLIDLRRKKFTIRDIVCSLEKSIIDYLAAHGIASIAKRDAPGVYVDERKICSIGLRVRKGCVYHGIAFNVNMDLSPFLLINPCGFKSLMMTQLRAYNAMHSPYEAGVGLIPFLMRQLHYQTHSFVETPSAA